MARTYGEAVRKLANVELSIREEHAPTGSEAVRSTPAFDLVLHLPAAQAGVQRARFEKESAELRKVIENSARQLTDEGFRSKAPAKIIEGMEAKLTGYRSQLAKIEASLASDLAS